MSFFGILYFGLIPSVYFWNDVKKHEVDFVIDRGTKLLPIEVKAGETLSSDQFKGLKYYQKIAEAKVEIPVLIYAGDETYQRNSIQVLSWKNL